MQAGKAASQRGFTLLALLAALALVSLAWSLTGPLWSQAQGREREAELLRVGLLYARALASYRDTLPGSIRSYPMALEELVRDPRIAGVRRHLRALYPDPLDPNRPWGIVRDEFGRIVGVYSQASHPPLRQGVLVLDGLTLPTARRVSDWKFLALPDRR